MSREADLDRTASNPTGDVRRDEPWMYGTPRKDLTESSSFSHGSGLKSVLEHLAAVRRTLPNLSEAELGRVATELRLLGLS